ncbi:MAG: response regulator transcription factor [Deltaproteobacteria bacterium]|nr:response regulator transcription factor [Deltaproteobacteria bacterium]
MGTRILIADDHQLFRQGLRALLEARSGLEVVAEAENGRRAVDLAAELAPDVVIMDLGMPELDGVEATRRITARTPSTHVIVLSMHEERHFIAEALGAGACGYVLKDCAFDEVDRALRAAEGGHVYLSPAIAGYLVEQVRGRAAGAGAVSGDTLSRREEEVLGHLAQGLKAREVADLLHVSVKTVETHRQNIMKKLGVTSAYELTKYSIRRGLTSLGP